MISRKSRKSIKSIKKLNPATIFLLGCVSLILISSLQDMSSKHTILFHGNCIDGWFSAYIANTVLSQNGTTKMFPIAPSQPNTWPSKEQMTGTHILLLDVSVAEEYRTAWLKAGALAVNCIDHHASAVEHWPADACPINTTACAALQTYRAFYPGAEVPFWLEHIDRIDRWDNPTYQDRCIREILNVISHLPVQKKIPEAIAMTEAFLLNMSNSIGYMGTVSQGKEILDQKDAALLGILTAGSFHVLTEAYITAWNLPSTWLNTKVFIIDNTNVTLDTTEAAHLVFLYNSDVTAFINYRKKVIHGRGAGAVTKEVYVYSARSRGFDLTQGTILRGHPTACGASLVKGEAPVLPFLLA